MNDSILVYVQILMIFIRPVITERKFIPGGSQLCSALLMCFLLDVSLNTL